MSAMTVPQTAVGSKVVQARGVSKIFKRDAFAVTALDNVTLDIAKGEFLALMGPSGSGKTTLLNMIAAIDRPSSGELLIMGENIFRLTDGQSASWRNAYVGYVFQTFNLIPVLTAFENVELPLLLTKMTAQQRRDHVMTALKLVGLEDRADHLPKQLSGGQEQRVAIARAIVSDPTLILADEPTGDLDSTSATEILEILKKLNENFEKTIVMVTHDPHAARYAHVIRHLEKGQLLPASQNGIDNKMNPEINSIAEVDLSTKSPAMAQVNLAPVTQPRFEAPEKLGGWLVLAAIGLVLGGVVNVPFLIWRFATLGAASNPGAFILLIDAGLTAFLIYAAVQFFAQKRNAPALLIALVIGEVIKQFLLIGAAVGPDAVESAKTGLVGTILAAAIWIPYFLVSKRVKRTFVVD
jgi:putative ABC transport system ATP-binding protein